MQPPYSSRHCRCMSCRCLAAALVSVAMAAHTCVRVLRMQQRWGAAKRMQQGWGLPIARLASAAATRQPKLSCLVVTGIACHNVSSTAAAAVVPGASLPSFLADANMPTVDRRLICGAPPCRTGWRGGNRSFAKGAAAVREPRAAAAGAAPTAATPHSIVCTAAAATGEWMPYIPGTAHMQCAGQGWVECSRCSP